MSKATAIAHPIQGLLKYHGLRDVDLRIPLHDSISVCTAPFETRTTVLLDDAASDDVFEIDGQIANGRAHERAQRVVDEVRRLAGNASRVQMRSANNFMSNIGLGASASGFAALALAATAAFGLHDISRRQLTTIARLGAGSASRAMAGGYAHWYAGDDHTTSYAEQIATHENLPLGIVIAMIPVYKLTEDAHTEAVSSPFMACRIAYAKALLDDIRKAILEGDFSTVGLFAEKDSLALHATTMTGNSNIIHWQPESVAVFHAVRHLRAEGIECYFSLDTGATVYVNCRPADVETVQNEIASLGLETAVAHVGGPARLVEDHLL
ncbi:MAG: diphosphomevalonate decarboxylase [Anaerolineales bacterium]